MLKTTEELQQEKTMLKAKYGRVETIIAPIEEDENGMDCAYATIYLKKHDRILISIVAKLATGPDPLKAVECFLKTTYVGGDDLSLILNNDDALMSCEGPVIELLQKKKATLIRN
jgi:hypothetical protein